MVARKSILLMLIVVGIMMSLLFLQTTGQPLGQAITQFFASQKPKRWDMCISYGCPNPADNPKHGAFTRNFCKPCKELKELSKKW